MRCDELNEDRVAVLYGEADPDTRARVNEHDAACATCREEMAALRGVRRRLSDWKLPASLRPRRPWRRVPVWTGWALPAAAALLIAVAGGVWTGAELHFANGELKLRLGPVAGLEMEQRLAQQEQRHHQQLQALRAELAAAPPGAPAPTAAALDDAALLARVEQLIAASENRQRTALRVGLDLVEQRRQYDMARVRTGFSYLEGRNGQDMANAMKVVSYVLATQPGADDAALRPR